MGYFAYCTKCSEGLQPTTLRELQEGYYCPHCHTKQPANRSFEDIVIDLIDTVDEQAQRIEQLELHVRHLTNGTEP